MKNFVLIAAVTASRLRAKLSSWPLIYRLSALCAGKKKGLVSRRTDLVIEGYPRSANTFALAAFSLAQNGGVEIASHHHSPAQIIQAVAWGIPALVLIREPKAAIISLLVRDNRIPPSLLLKQYVGFYSPLLEVGDKVVWANFEDVIVNFGEVIRRINEHYGRTFREFKHDKENLNKTFALVEEYDLIDTGGTGVNEYTVARPSIARGSVAARCARSLEREEFASLVADATDLYAQIVSGLCEGRKS